MNAVATLSAALLLYGVVVGVQLTAPPGSRSPSVLVALPAVVALSFGPAVIVGPAAVAVGTRWAFLVQDPRRVGAALGTTAAVCVIADLACFVVRRRERTAARMGQILAVAESVQTAVLRSVPPRVGGLRAAAEYRSAAEFARIGGDLYAVVDSPFGVCGA
ncbi:hypothetical protein [Yinghuangia aomiensis]|uniref:hypothetical protein n=1 Tax=Yinghuangia aomiensis TaxID=676205 RepID=UPI0031EA6B85